MALPAIVAIAASGFIKAVLIKLFTVILIYVFYKFLSSYLLMVFDWALNKMGGLDLSDATMQFTGLAAWVFQVMEINSTLSLLLSFLITKFIMGFVKR